MIVQGRKKDWASTRLSGRAVSIAFALCVAVGGVVALGVALVPIAEGVDVIAEDGSANELPRTDADGVVPLSIGELQIIQFRMSSDRTDLRNGDAPSDLPIAIRGTKGVYDLSINVDGHSIVVGVEEPSGELATAFRSYYDDVLIELRRGVVTAS